jgi:hypothetical protein
MLQSGGWPAPPYWINFSAGIILTGILWFLRLRYPWFWLNPIGIVIPSVVWPPGPWSCFFFAWILKFVTFKIGGSKLYEKIVPVMIGLIIGAFLMIFLQGLTQAVISVSA